MATEEKTGYEALDDWERTVINSSNSTIRSDGRVSLRGENAMRLNQLLQYRTGLLKDKERLESELAFDSRLDPEQTINGQRVKLSDEERKKLENKLSGINSEITGIESGSIGVSNPKVVQGQTVTEIEEGAPLPYTIQPTTSSSTTTTTQQSSDVVGVVTSTLLLLIQ